MGKVNDLKMLLNRAGSSLLYTYRGRLKSKGKQGERRKRSQKGKIKTTKNDS